MLARSLTSEFPLEAAAAVQARHAEQPTGGGDLLLERLRQLPHPLLRSTVIALLARDTGELTDATPVEVVRDLISVPALAGALFIHHEALAPYVRQLQPAEGARLFSVGERSDGIWHVLSGGIQMASPVATFGPGATAGLTEFYGRGRWRQSGTALRGTRLLHVPLSALEQVIQQHPSLGLALLRYKLCP